MAMILSVLIQGLVCLGFMFLARLLLPELFTTVHISYFLQAMQEAIIKIKSEISFMFYNN